MKLQLRPAPHVVTAVEERWPEVGREWALAVPDELTQLCARFDAAPVRRLPTRYGFVVAVSTPNGPLVLRASPDPAGRVQAEVSRALAKVGAGPSIHAVVATATGTWTAMEQIDPGTPLDLANLSRDVVHGVVNVLGSLMDQPSPLPNMPRLNQWLRKRLDDDRLTDVAPGHVVASLVERRRAMSVLGDLAKQPDRQNLCHGDLHPGNALVRADGRLFLIDPRGVSGEVAYDVAVIALKAVGGATAAARAVAVQLAMCIGVDSERTEAWVRVASAARV